MRRPLVAGNWKMNGSKAMAASMVRALAGSAFACDVVLCPPASYLAKVGDLLQDTAMKLGAQDCSEYAPGAYTGEIAAEMLVDLGCQFTILGHSERRQMFGDSDERVFAKVRRAQAHGLTTILCVGETLEERKTGATSDIVGEQLRTILEHKDAESLLRSMVIAYEPIWAIGTGETATPEQAQAVHETIRQLIAAAAPERAASVRILYGGSVKPDNAAELFAMPDIDGGLIGGASLEAASFGAICDAAVQSSGRNDG